MTANYKWLGPPLALLPVLLAVAYVLIWNPTDASADPLSGCWWHHLFHVNGPTCGGTRAFYYLMHGNLLQAARYHLPFVVSVPFMVYAWLAWLLSARLPAFHLRRWYVVAFGLFWLLWTVVRNLIPWLDIPNMIGG